MTIPWHRIFGMALTQYFAGTAWKVDVEVDLSLQQQRLDVVVLRRGEDAPEPQWPDGFGEPAEYNLLTFKALKHPLDGWSLKELAGHAVTYCKFVSPNVDDLLPAENFRMLAACMRFPRQLARQVTLQPQGPGTYDVIWGIDTIRVLVLREMPDAEQNLVWNLFSSDQERIQSAFQRLQPRVQNWSSLLNGLLEFYGLEGMHMPYTMEQFERDVAEKVLRKLTPEQRLADLSLNEIEAYVEKQKARKLTLEERLADLSLDEIEAYVKKQKAQQKKSPSDEEKPERQDDDPA